MNQLAKEIIISDTPEAKAAAREVSERGVLRAPAEQADSLFERFAWLYIFCREKVFRDDTQRMVAALWPDGKPPDNTRLIELGCGPGFYSCRLASLFPGMSVLGVDRSEKQLNWAREKARLLGLHNCTFDCLNVLALACPDETFDILIASRLFTVLRKPERTVGEIFRVLRKGGRCFIAEPRCVFWASLPLYAMWVLASLTHYENGYREPRKASILSHTKFQELFHSQPWAQVRTWQEGRYQYAVCEKR